MMGRQDAPAQLFYEFDLDRHVPANHLLREIDRFLDVDGLRDALRPFYSHLGRPSIDPELIVRMLVVGYVMGIRSERRLCDEVHLNLAYRWFCRLGLEDKVPDHSTFSKYRHGKFRDCDLLRRVFDRSETGRHASTWRLSMTPPLGRPRQSSRSSWPSPIRRRNGREPRRADPILPMPRTT